MQLDPDGAQLFPAAFSPARIDALASAFAAFAPGHPGARLAPIPGLTGAVRPATRIARFILGPRVRAVRATLFDKSPELNWALGWHQDRTIAVRRRVDTPGFSDWTMKAGIAHVVPPFAMLEKMLTVRIHLDPARSGNAPLLVIPGSHRFGRVAERDIPAIAAGHRHAACPAERGDLWLYAAPILHASAPALQPGRRRVLQLLYSADELPNGLEWLGI